MKIKIFRNKSNFLYKKEFCQLIEPIIEEERTDNLYVCVRIWKRLIKVDGGYIEGGFVGTKQLMKFRDSPIRELIRELYKAWDYDEDIGIINLFVTESTTYREIFRLFAHEFYHWKKRNKTYTSKQKREYYAERYAERMVQERYEFWMWGDGIKVKSFESFFNSFFAQRT
ncbi:hypothetical protein ES708_24201 [subsurface metagenome]